MESELFKRNKRRDKRAAHVSKRVRGSQDKPRLSLNKTNRHIHIQLIDDEEGRTLASISTLSSEFKTTEFNKKNKTSAKELGLKIAALAKEKNIERCVFDRRFYKFHGILAAVAEGAREGGLTI